MERVARTLPKNLRLLATTATANDRVMEDLRDVLGPNLTVFKGDLNRPSLALQTIRLPGQAERLAWLAEQLPHLPGSGIIYCLTVRDANQVSEWLRSRGLHVAAYTGGTGERRPELEEALLANRIKALVATTALGMGFDKPDLAFVIHFQTPGSVVHYYQQVGRAGRALPAAYGVLLSGIEEARINEFFISSAFPSKAEVGAVLDQLEQAPDGLSVPELETRVNLSHGRIQKTIDLLSLESPAPLVKQGARWQFQDWSPEPAPAWVTCVPSLRHPELVPDFARRLAERLGLPFHGILEKTKARPEQKSMANSAQQAMNLDGSLAVRGTPSPTPVLLVDDMVDSRWTMTVATWLLRRHGSGPVWPLALALTGHDE